MCGVGRERRPKPKIARRMPPMTETPIIKIAMIIFMTFMNLDLIIIFLLVRFIILVILNLWMRLQADLKLKKKMLKMTD